jgi:TNF receptor-associated protein 1
VCVGSKAFVEAMDKEPSGSDVQKNIIGQFGVGFYSAFMVGHKIQVFTRSAKAADSQGYCWASDGYVVSLV